MTKSLGFLVFFVCFSSIQNIPAKSSNDAHQECKKETNYHEELRGESSTEWMHINQTVYKEYVLCYTKKMGLLNQNGDFQKNAIKTSLEHIRDLYSEDLDEVVDKCAVKKETPQESAYHLIICLMESIHK